MESLVAYVSSPWFAAIIGLVVAVLGTVVFRGEAGLILIGFALIGILVAAVAGVLSTLLPATAAIVSGRIALFGLVFSVSTYLLDR